MSKLTLALALLLLASVAAHAQTPGRDSDNNPVGRQARRMGEAAKVEEDHINAMRLYTAETERVAAARRAGSPQTFKAEVEVTNHAAKSIKAVTWTATLTNPNTGSVIRSYDVKTETLITPGSTKKLSMYLRRPRADPLTRIMTPIGKSPVARLKVAVTGVTYADGTTSTTP